MKTIHYFLSICMCLAACTGNGDPEEELEIEEPCPDLSDVNPHFAYGDYLLERLAYMGMERPSDSYNYPVYPGMAEWGKLSSTAERRALCQVTPECLLRKMSTQAVIQAIWELPVIEEFMIFSDPLYQININGQERLYNAYKELFKRKDAVAALLKRLTLVIPYTYFPRYESQVLEFLLCHPDFFSQLNESEKRKIVEITLSNDEKRYGVWVYDGFGFPFARTAAWILMGKAMYTIGYEPFIMAMNENKELKYFIEGWRPNPSDPSKMVIYFYNYSDFFDGNIPQLITDHAKNFIND